MGAIRNKAAGDGYAPADQQKSVPAPQYRMQNTTHISLLVFERVPTILRISPQTMDVTRKQDFRAITMYWHTIETFGVYNIT